MIPGNLSTQTFAGTVPVFLSGSNWFNSTAAGVYQIKSSIGVYNGLTVNTVGTTSSATFYDGISSVVTITIAAPGVISWTGHPFVAGNAVFFTNSGGGLPTGLTALTLYYVSITGLTANAFSVADTQAHALAGTNNITTTGTSTGTQTSWQANNPIGKYSTTAQVNLPTGLQFQNGLIANVVDAGSGNLTVAYI